MRRMPSTHREKRKQNSRLRVLQEVECLAYFRLEKTLQVRLHGRPRYHSWKAGDTFDGSMLRPRRGVFLG